MLFNVFVPTNTQFVFYFFPAQFVYIALSFDKLKNLFGNRWANSVWRRVFAEIILNVSNVILLTKAFIHNRPQTKPWTKINADSSTANLDISVDLIRAVAIVAVIFLHATADLTVVQMNQFEIIRWTTNDVYQSIGRICIPLFAMLSGGTSSAT